MTMGSFKLIVFDLDGVLIDSKDLHFRSLNSALRNFGREFEITHDEHISIYDGLSTSAKLEILEVKKGLPRKYFESIWTMKQKFTHELLDNIKPDIELVQFMEYLKKSDYKLCVASNSIKSTIQTSLSRLGIDNYFDLKLGNEDVVSQKPHPEIYWKAMLNFKALPEETVIIEDSYVGRLAAQRSGAHLIPIDSRGDLTWETIKNIEKFNPATSKITKPWKSQNLNVLIPMAGLGSRFESAGYSFPKPLIEVNGKPMIQVVVENLNIEANYIYLVQKTHFEKFNLNYLLNLVTPNCKIIQVDELTQGAACTTLLAEKFIDNEFPLLIANSDQFIEWNSSKVMYSFMSSGIHGGIVTFNSTHPKWSFVKVDNLDMVLEVAEKKPISDMATVGIYYWALGSDYVNYAKEMIRKNLTHNGEFYVCPVFNEAINDGKKIKAKKIDKMWGLGTPEDLNYFLKHYSGTIR